MEQSGQFGSTKANDEACYYLTSNEGLGKRKM